MKDKKIYFFESKRFLIDGVAWKSRIKAEGEDIEVLELPLDTNHAAVESGLIVDGKTITSLYHVALKGVL
ncbi:hypothetical protein [Klebsiella oxytoca]|uniref:hypothetical protein n=1 Tax=Klebsiella oxytoca TaxID=571 RepID=UPI0020C35D82|nr:hypothetical protein [Klebsiella oxytoca]